MQNKSVASNIDTKLYTRYMLVLLQDRILELLKIPK